MCTHRKKLLVLSVVSVLVYTTNAQSKLTIGNTVVGVDTVITGLDIPWEIIWGPDNHIWTTERKGIVSRINPNTKSKNVILDISSQVFQQSESGLLGMVLHPDFSTIPEVFIVYTYGSFSNIKERLVKYTYNGNSLVNPDTLIDSITGNTTHDGSRLIFLPDKTLLMTTGDAQNQSSPQNLSSLNGKVLRLKTDGTIPSDNPFAGSYVYSFGHRNAQGMLLAPNGKIYLSEHGASSDDEFQILLKGRNYGWPNVEGFCNKPAEVTFCSANNVVEPLVAWTPTNAPSDMVYYMEPSFPEFDSCILLTILKDKKLIAIKLNVDGSKVIKETHYLTNVFGRLRDICIGPDNEIYLATNGDSWTNTDPNTHSIVRLTLSNNTSVKKSHYRPKVRIYPNPVNGALNIDMDDLRGEQITAQLLDISGRVCKEEVTSETNIQLSMEDLSKGIYILKVISNGKTIFLTKILY